MQVATRSLSIVHLALIAPIALFLGSFQTSQEAKSESETISFDSGLAWSHLEKLVAFGDRSVGQPGLEKTRAFLVEQLKAAGLEPRREAFSQETPLLGKTEFANVVADLPATPGAPVVILMTHFDTKSFAAPGAPKSEGFQGANDGGSGTAVLLELARVLKASKKPHSVQYRFLFVDGEEATRWHWAGKDNTYGSRHHVEELRKAKQLKQVGAVVLLDMVGDKDLKLNREGNSTRELVEIFFNAAKAAGLGKHVGGSTRMIDDDHKSFLAHGIPSVDLIDFNYGPSNGYWHDPRDTLENCSKESLDAIGQIVLAGLPGVETFVLKNAQRVSRKK